MELSLRLSVVAVHSPDFTEHSVDEMEGVGHGDPVNRALPPESQTRLHSFEQHGVFFAVPFAKRVSPVADFFESEQDASRECVAGSPPFGYAEVGCDVRRYVGEDLFDEGGECDQFSQSGQDFDQSFECVMDLRSALAQLAATRNNRRASFHDVPSFS